MLVLFFVFSFFFFFSIFRLISILARTSCFIGLNEPKLQPWENKVFEFEFSVSLYTSLHECSTQAVAEQGRLLCWSGPGEARVDVVGFLARGSHDGVDVV